MADKPTTATGYVVRNYGSGVDEVGRRLRPLLDDPSTARAIAVLRSDFSKPNGVGPRRVAQFLSGGPDDSTQADVVGYVAALLRGLDQGLG